MIRIENLNKYFGEKHVLKDINLEIEKGEVVALIGPSGSGKSTLIRCIDYLEEPTSGNIYIDGEHIAKAVKNIDRIRQKIGMVFQHFNLFPHKTVLENITLAPILTGRLTKDEAENKALELLKTMDLLDKKNAYPNSLSGGQKQRIAIARVFLKNPPILIFDEATSALDLESEHLIQEALLKLAKDRTTIIVAHRLSTITHADQIIMIENGEITETGTHEELMEKRGNYEKLFQIQQLDHS